MLSGGAHPAESGAVDRKGFSPSVWKIDQPMASAMVALFAPPGRSGSGLAGYRFDA